MTTLKAALTYHLENPRALRNYARAALPVSVHGAAKPGRQHGCSQHGFLGILNPLLRSTAQKKRSLSEYHCPWTTPWSPKSSDGAASQRGQCCFHAWNMAPTYHGAIPTSQSYHLTNTLHEAVHGPGQSIPETFWARCTVPDAIANICGSWEGVTMSTLVGVWKKRIPPTPG